MFTQILPWTLPKPLSHTLVDLHWFTSAQPVEVDSVMLHWNRVINSDFLLATTCKGEGVGGGIFTISLACLCKTKGIIRLCQGAGFLGSLA